MGEKPKTGNESLNVEINAVGSGVVSMAWREYGACRNLDPGMFFPEDEENARAAKAICEQCDVRVICLEWALANREKHGVWGGASERDRRAILRRQRRTQRSA